MKWGYFIGGILVLALALMVTAVHTTAAPPGVPSTSTQASADYFLKIDGIEGESTDDKHKNQIEILSYSWGATQTGTHAGGGGGGAGKATFQDISFTTTTSKASPKLMEALAKGQHIKEATLAVRKAGSKEDYLIIKLEDIIVTSYQQDGANNAVPTDSFSLNYAKIEFKYSPQNRDGSLGTPIVATWNIQENRE